MQRLKPVTYSLKATQTTDQALSITTRKNRRFYNFIQAVKNSEIEKYSLKVSYGLIIDNNNKKVLAKNEGEYNNKENLLLALKCFCEK